MAVQPDNLSRVERRKLRTRTALIDAARKITAKNGMDALTIRDVTNEADIAMGSFYQHFESKEQLIEEAVREITYQSGEIIDRINATSSNPLETVARAFMTFDGMIQTDPILGWFMVRMSSHNPDWTSTLYDRFRRDVNAGVDAGVFSVPNVTIAIDAAGASLFSFYRARLIGNADENAVPHFVHLMLRMLGADESSAQTTAQDVWNEILAQRKKG